MIARYTHLSRAPVVFQALTGLTRPQFDDWPRDAGPRLAAAEQPRLSRPDRQRAIGGGHRIALSARDQVLLTVVWLRRYPIYEGLGYLFGLSQEAAVRTVARVLPVLEAAGLDTRRLPDPGKGRRPQLDALLAETPDLAVLIDPFEQRVQRPKDRAEADRPYRGKKQQHTLMSQVAVDERDGRIVDVAASVRGPTSDLTLLRESELLQRLPAGVGALGDLA